MSFGNFIKNILGFSPAGWISKGISRVFGKNDGVFSSLGSFLGNLDLNEQLGSFVNTISGAHLTGSQIEANEMQMQNAEDIYQRQVSGMQSAGLNPALMYDKGVSGSVPAAPTNSASGSMSDLMQLILLPLQAKMMRSQISNVNADTDVKEAEATGKGIENDFKPAILEQNLRKGELDISNLEIGIEKTRQSILNLQSEMSVNESVIALNEAQVREVLSRANKEDIEAANEALRAAGIRANNQLIAENVVLARLNQALVTAETVLTSNQSSKVVAETGFIGLQSFEQQYNNLWLGKYGSKPSDNAASKFINLIQKSATHKPDWSGFVSNIGLGWLF